MEPVNIRINGRELQVSGDSTIFEAARDSGIYVPNLCYEQRLEPYGACRLCLVQVEGARGLLPSCTTQVTDGMIIETETEDLVRIRRTLIGLLLSDHPQDCMTCESGGQCQLQDLAYNYGVRQSPYLGATHEFALKMENPLIERDYNKCILCGRCIRICRQVQGVGVYDFVNRGFKAVPGTPYDLPMQETPCEFCGQCVSTCPTGAITAIPSKGTGRVWQVEKVRTTCSYCGCGCQLDLQVRSGKVVEASSPVMEGPGQGNLCVKGRFGYGFIDHPDRLTRPLIRKNGELKEVSWDEALEYVAGRLTDVKAEFGADSIGFLTSARITNEENYLVQKFARAVIGTNHVDHCARLCHSSTVAGLAKAFGSGAMTNSFDDLETAECILVIGSNTTETHPIVGLRIKKAVMKNGCKLIVAEPRHTRLCYYAAQWMRQKPGTDVALINGMMNVILAEGLADEAFIAERTEGFDELKKVVADFSPERAAAITGLEPEEIRQAARTFASAKSAAIVYAMGITQHTTGVDNVLSTANLAMLTGNIGRPGTGVNPLRGQNNVQGACDMGGLPGDLTAYQKVADDAARAKFEKAWGVTLPAKPGLTLMEMMNAVHEGDIKALYIVGENPMVSDPDLHHVGQALQGLGLLIVQDIFLTETATLADVVLPAASFAEKDGTFTNTERRVQRVRKAVTPPGNARADSHIIADLAARMGYTMPAVEAADVMAEIATLTPSYAGITYDRLERGSLQWPVPDAEHPGTPILHTAQFTRGKGLFHAIDYRPAAEQPDADYPFILTTGRVLAQYHTGTMTRRVEALEELAPHNHAELNPVDAASLGITDGDMVALETRRGAIRLQAKVTSHILPGVVFTPFHYAEAAANELTSAELDPVAKIPEYKVCAVKVLTGKEAELSERKSGTVSA